MAPLLRLSGVVKRFGQVQALAGVDLELGADELLVVLGPTGAGKTTLLRTIAGLEVPDEGRLELGGEEITHWPPATRDVAMVFQNFALYPDWSVRQNLEFPLKAPGRRLARAQIDERVQWAAGLLHIEGLLDRPATRLSGGEMQRVAIGRCLVRRPRLFLLDEPLTNLDAKLREALRVELAVLRRQLGIPMILVTHDQAEALSMGDRLVVLGQGQVLQSGSPEEVYRRPVSPLVARQLGQPRINLLQVRWQGGHWVAGQGVRVLEAGQEGERMQLGVRPEDLAPEGGLDPARVQVVEDTGPAQILLIDWGGCPVHLLVAKDFHFAPGDQIFPRVKPGQAVLWPCGDE
ncbi:MAG: ABC transporter ATP-binding protein [Candidatus Latescibacteria bacterium]|nr:ABC transporter ATP-binding protein [Candidatus Latescibacterota bacterium]